MRAAMVRAGSVSDQVPWGSATRSTWRRSDGRPESSAAARHRLEHQVGDRHARRGRGDADQDRRARGGVARGRIHDWRCYGPPMAKSDTARWEAALDGFTKESFEADGKRRDIYRAGHGPAVIIISEMPGITPLVAEFGRKVVAAGCTAVMPHIFGDPGRPASGVYVLQSFGPACISREFCALRPEEDQPDHGLAAQAGGGGARTLWWTGGRCRRHVLHRRLRAGHDGRRHRAGTGAQSAVAALAVDKKHKADIGISDADLARVKERTAAGTCLLGPAVQQRPLLLRGRGSPPCGASWGMRSLRWSSTRRRAIRTGIPRTAHSVLTEHLQDREGTPTRAALDQTLTFFREKLGVGTGPGPEAGPGE